MNVGDESVRRDASEWRRRRQRPSVRAKSVERRGRSAGRSLDLTEGVVPCSRGICMKN